MLNNEHLINIWQKNTHFWYKIFNQTQAGPVAHWAGPAHVFNFSGLGPAQVKLIMDQDALGQLVCPPLLHTCHYEAALTVKLNNFEN